MKPPKIVPEPVIPLDPPEVFYQSIALVDHGQEIGRASWHTIGDGVIQILDLHIAEDHQRQGQGSTLLNALYDQVKAFHKARGTAPRRLWLSVQQAGHLKCRAFLSRHGYHHTVTLKHLFHRQDAMIYQRGFD